jgi:hypothetical protein
VISVDHLVEVDDEKEEDFDDGDTYASAMRQRAKQADPFSQAVAQAQIRLGPGTSGESHPG